MSIKKIVCVSPHLLRINDGRGCRDGSEVTERVACMRGPELRSSELMVSVRWVWKATCISSFGRKR